jgi:hypothetical protein
MNSMLDNYPCEYPEHIVTKEPTKMTFKLPKTPPNMKSSSQNRNTVQNIVFSSNTYLCSAEMNAINRNREVPQARRLEGGTGASLETSAIEAAEDFPTYPRQMEKKLNSTSRLSCVIRNAGECITT